ncbi:hypothetical protein [Erythrobacter sp. Alg231-14]|uniref:hypothetical protein n=1 Tax=Erythrobacter sp. Alg231-14 TaxID=1922225 RepID=UPI00307C8D78
MALELFVFFAALGAMFLVLQATALGLVLILKFLLGNLAPGRRIAIVIVGTVFLLFLPVFIVLVTDGATDIDAEIAAVLGLFMAICATSVWPAAHIATRRLDRMTQFDLEPFK